MSRQPTRAPQLAYSESQPLMTDEQHRRRKAAKIVEIVKHFSGRETLDGLRAVDVGCSAGFVAHELSRSGAVVAGTDIDEPGLQRARNQFGAEVGFFLSDGAAIPLAGASQDLVVFNHIYEHVVDPDAVMAEIRRVLKPDGFVYLGLGNKYGVMEPHYRLPFLSWLPRGVADRYVRAAGRADTYYEQFRSPRGIRKLCAGLEVWDYTYAVLGQPEAFASDDMVRGPLTRVPDRAWRALSPIIPTFIWIGTPGDRSPAGPALRVPPTKLPLS